MHKHNTAVVTSQSVNLAALRSFIDSSGAVVLPAEESPRTVTRGLSLHGDSVARSDAFPDGVVIDWLAFMLPCASPDAMRSQVYEMLTLFGGGEDLQKGFRGYTHSYSILAGDGRLAFHPDRLDMGVYVELPSSALKLMRGMEILGEVKDFLEWLLQRDAKISRLDVAIDSDEVTIETVRSAVISECFVSRCTWVNETRFLRGKPGHTIYVGSPTADRRVRFYDKAAEQGLNTKESLEKGIPPIVWTRAEIQHRDKYAMRAARVIVSGSVDMVALFNEILDFRDVTGDSNVSRRPRSDWWQSWVGKCIEKCGFPFEKVEKTVGRVYDWLKLQVAPSLAMLAIAAPEIRFWLHSVIDEGFTRLDNTRREKARLFNQSGLSLCSPSLSASPSPAQIAEFNQWVRVQAA